MKRIEIYIDNNGSLAVSEFKNLNSQYEKLVLKGMQTYEYIRKLASSNLVDLYENKRRNDILLEYKNCVITINDYNKILNKKGMAPLIRNIKDFKERETLTKNTAKKVTRRNKYSSRRIIASGLTALVISGCAYGFLNKEIKLEHINATTQTVSEIQTESEQKNKEKAFSFEVDTSLSKESSNVTLTEPEIRPVSINYEDRSSSDKVYVTKAYYWEIIKKYSKQYGLDPNLVLAIATQEKGIHSNIKDKGGATGLMQIQNGVWENQNISAYNFNTKKNETIYVTKDKIGDLYNNIKFGCMYLQNCMEYMNYNVVAAVQCYNMGHGNMMNILKAYSRDTNRSINDILNDKYDTGWLNYRYLPGEGDSQYVENVFSWLGTDFQIKNIKTNNSLVTLNVSNELKSKKVY